MALSAMAMADFDDIKGAKLNTASLCSGAVLFVGQDIWLLHQMASRYFTP